MATDLTTGLLLQPEAAPPIVRSGGRGGQPHEWEKIIGPTISGSPGQDFIIYLYPEGEKPEGGWSEEVLAQAKRQAAARAASIANRYWNEVPTEHVQTSVRQREDGTYGVYATHHGAMTDEARTKMAKRRQPRGSSLVDAPGDDETEAVAPPATDPAPTPTAAERVAKAAASKSAAPRRH